jgi:hypothetical protein
MNEQMFDGRARAHELARLARIYSWDMKAEEACRWPYRLLRRVMDIGTFEDIISMERQIGDDELTHALRTAEAGALRPKSWTFWHYRLGLVPPGQSCPSLPARRAA